MARDPLLVSSVNGGGLFLVEGERVERLSRIDTTGIAVIDGGFLLARQAEGSAELRRLHGRDVDRITLADRSLDLHDLHQHGDRLYVVGTELNTIYEFGPGFSALRHWPLAEATDSQHVNSICVHDGRLLASRFGAFERHRGYKGRTRSAGEIFDVETGEVLVSGLSQPHSLASMDGLLWVCDSETYTLRAYRDFKPAGEYRFDGYVRGLAFGESAAYVGLSRSRNDPDPRLPSACVVVLDRVTMEERGRLPVPANEVYDLCLVEPGGVDDLRAAALADAHAEYDVLARDRDAARAEARELGQRAMALDAALQAHQAAHAAGEAAARVTAREQADDAAGEAEWLRMLAADNAWLHAGLDAARDDIAAQARALHDLQAFVDTVVASPWWRVPGLRPRGLRLPPRVPTHVAPAQARRFADRADVPLPGLGFRAHAAPQVSIVVVARGGFPETLACLRSIQRAGADATFEVIVVGDPSRDRDIERLRSVPGLHYHAGEHGRGILESADQVLTHARGEYVHLLDGAACVRPGWLDTLLRTFALFNDCGMAGSSLVGADGRLQAAGGIVSADGEACLHGRGAAAADPAYATVREVDFVPASSVLLPTALLRALGGFGEAGAQAGYGDIELAFRVRSQGRKVYVQPASVVVHGGRAWPDDPSGSDDPTRGRDAFVARWCDTLARDQLGPGAHPFLARERGQLKKMVLVVDRVPPRTDRDAGSRAIWQLMRVLFLHGFVVKFRAEQADDGDGAYLELLRIHGIEPVEGDGDDFQAWLATNGRYLDHVVLSRPLVAARHIDLVRSHTTASVVYYGHDIHYLRLERQFAITRDAGLDAQARHLRSVERGLWRTADLVLYPSSEETIHVREWIAATGSGGRVDTVPLFAYEGVEPVASDAGSLQARRDVLFVGGFAHAPNEDGVVWFSREVWPLVRARAPGHRLCLVGASPPATVAALAADDVLVAGPLTEDALVAQYARTRVAVAPLRFGAGTKGKVLEALRHGVPCVTTTTGAQGLAAARGLRVSDDAASMAREIVMLLADDAAWRQASSEGQAFIREGFSTSSVWEVLAGVMDAGAYPSVEARLARLGC